MKFIIECDGAVLDVQPPHWQAYSTACEELALARTDPAAFWRALRRGASHGELARGVKPAKLREFSRLFSERFESDDCLAALIPHPEVASALAALRRAGECFLVTAGRNRGARQRVLDANDLSVHFSRMKALSDDRSRRVEQLRVLSEQDPRTIVAVTSESLILAAEEAGLFAAGISSGACTAARLTRVGARCAFADLAELAESVANGADELVTAGLTPQTRFG